jgi:tRNA 2-thiouridine synthesizing protein A
LQAKQRLQSSAGQLTPCEIHQSNSLMSTPQADGTLDARGLRCPEPVMLLHKAMAGLASGDRLLVLATDPTTQHDIPQFCRFLGHELAQSEERDDEFRFILIKGT